jgi:hypothetical protein
MKAKNIMERVKTIEDAFEVTGRPKVDFSNVPEDLRAYFENQYNAVVVTEALNEGYKPNWDNSRELKWRPWFAMSPSSFRFCDAGCECSSAPAGAGSRLCSKSEEIARYSAQQFEEIWKGVQLG